MGTAFVAAPFCLYPVDYYLGLEAVTSWCQDVSIRIPYKWLRPKERLVLKSELSTSKQKATKQGSRAHQWPLPAPPWKSELEGSQECVTSQLMPENAPSWKVEKEQGLQTLEKWNLPSKELPQSIYPLVDLQGLTLKWFPPSTLKLKRMNHCLGTIRHASSQRSLPRILWSRHRLLLSTAREAQNNEVPVSLGSKALVWTLFGQGWWVLWI